ncbi:hypothetical protein C8J57DRAFT_1467698 [Mycena rebaudengoi]|nr:hypothetical protein C8J57DRAFT_1467698 [Mycena rebaudengoi]
MRSTETRRNIRRKRSDAFSLPPAMGHGARTGHHGGVDCLRQPAPSPIFTTAVVEHLAGNTGRTRQQNEYYPTSSAPPPPRIGWRSPTRASRRSTVGVWHAKLRAERPRNLRLRLRGRRSTRLSRPQRGSPHEMYAAVEIALHVRKTNLRRASRRRVSRAEGRVGGRAVCAARGADLRLRSCAAASVRMVAAVERILGTGGRGVRRLEERSRNLMRASRRRGGAEEGGVAGARSDRPGKRYAIHRGVAAGALLMQRERWPPTRRPHRNPVPRHDELVPIVEIRPFRASAPERWSCAYFSEKVKKTTDFFAKRLGSGAESNVRPSLSMEAQGQSYMERRCRTILVPTLLLLLTPHERKGSI